MSSANFGVPSGSPGWVKQLVKWLSILAVVLGAFAAVLYATGNLKKAYCGLADCPVPNKPESPLLPGFKSENIGGGHTQEEICGPKRDSYALAYPSFNIQMKVAESSDKNFLGHETYEYDCSYVAVPK